MKKIIPLLFIFFTTALPAQQRGLLAIKLSSENSDTLKQHLFVEGEQVRIIFVHDSLPAEKVEGKLTAITDSSVVIDAQKTIAISTIKLMGYKTPRKIRLRRAGFCVVSCAVMVASAVVIHEESDGEIGPITNKEIVAEMLFVGGVTGTTTYLVFALLKYTELDFDSGHCKMRLVQGEELQLLKK